MKHWISAFLVLSFWISSQSQPLLACAVEAAEMSGVLSPEHQVETIAGFVKLKTEFGGKVHEPPYPGRAMPVGSKGPWSALVGRPIIDAFGGARLRDRLGRLWPFGEREGVQTVYESPNQMTAIIVGTKGHAFAATLRADSRGRPDRDVPPEIQFQLPGDHWRGHLEYHKSDGIISVTNNHIIAKERRNSGADAVIRRLDGTEVARVSINNEAVVSAVMNLAESRVTLVELGHVTSIDLITGKNDYHSFNPEYDGYHRVALLHPDGKKIVIVAVTHGEVPGYVYIVDPTTGWTYDAHPRDRAPVEFIKYMEATPGEWFNVVGAALSPDASRIGVILAGGGTRIVDLPH